MIPDINLDRHHASPTQSEFTEGKFPTVGIVFGQEVSDDKIKRFERILKCYADFRHYTPPATASNENEQVETRLQPAVLRRPEETAERSLVPAGDAKLSENQNQVNLAKMKRCM